MEHLSDLALFLRVLDLGSISAAARSLDITAAGASQRLRRLERALGVRLLHRTTRRLHPTAEGARLAERGRALLDEAEALTEELGGPAVRGVLRVTMPTAFGRLHVAPLFPAFLAAHPQLRIEAHFSDRYEDLVASGFDLALRVGELRDSALVARPLARNRRVLCAAPAYLERHGVPKRPQDLARHNCLVLTNPGERQDIWRFRDGAGEVAVRVRGNLESNLGEVLREAAVAGLGIGLHSTWHVYGELRTGRLVPLLPRHPAAGTVISAVMPDRRLVPARVRAFVAFLEQRIGDPPYWDRGLAARAETPRRRAAGRRRAR